MTANSWRCPSIRRMKPGQRSLRRGAVARAAGHQRRPLVGPLRFDALQHRAQANSTARLFSPRGLSMLADSTASGFQARTSNVRPMRRQRLSPSDDLDTGRRTGALVGAPVRTSQDRCRARSGPLERPGTLTSTCTLAGSGGLVEGVQVTPTPDSWRTSSRQPACGVPAGQPASSRIRSRRCARTRQP